MSLKKEFKVVLIGDSGSGKTSFVHNLVNGRCPEKHIPTIGVEVFSVEFGEAKIHFWDTAGDQSFACLADGYYIEADAALCFADASSPDCLYSFQKWETYFTQAVPNVPVIRVLNKIDLIPDMWLSVGPDGPTGPEGISGSSSLTHFLISSKYRRGSIYEPIDALIEMLTSK